jgi:hypothetical protein
VVVGKIRLGRRRKVRQPCVVVLRHASYQSEKVSAVVTVYIAIVNLTCSIYYSPWSLVTVWNING